MEIYRRRTISEEFQPSTPEIYLLKPAGDIPPKTRESQGERHLPPNWKKVLKGN
ncbi:hypothetical protein HanPSC8_Chr17g0758721 [Helianthus annuus]|nr:hypothetical protein HanPSC8_Chr17g0758721 [Helianthus annuus]